MEFNFTFNKVYKPVFTTKARYIDVWGGRGAGRSHFGTDYFLYLITRPMYFRGAFLRHVFGDIRDSLFKDFKDRLDASDFNPIDFDINETTLAITYIPTGNSIISKGFKKSSGNRSAKLKSLAGLTHVLIEEADENNENDVNKLDDSIRTDKIEDIQVIFLHNPPSKNHWLVKRFYNLEDTGIIGHDGRPIPYYRAVPKVNPDVLVIHSTYKDNIKNLNKKTVWKYEEYNVPGSPFYNEEYYYVDVMGLIPEGARGRIYKGWHHITTEFFNGLPYEEYYGLDFGYSGDPIALIRIKSHNNRNFYKQIIYEKELTNPALASLMRIRGVKPNSKVFADSSEPKSIKELQDLGFKQVMPAEKGPDSVKFGIKVIKSNENYATEDSKDLWNENEEYKWVLDSDGEPTDDPEDKNNHAKDAIRYGVTGYKSIKRKAKIVIAKSGTVPSAAPQSENPLDWL